MREVVHHSVSSLLFIDDMIFPGGEKKRKKKEYRSILKSLMTAAEFIMMNHRTPSWVRLERPLGII